MAESKAEFLAGFIEEELILAHEDTASESTTTPAATQAAAPQSEAAAKEPAPVQPASPEPAPAPAPKPTSEPLPPLLVLAHVPKGEMPAAEKALLQMILKATQLPSSEIKVVNTAKGFTGWADAASAGAKTAVAFGLPQELLPEEARQPGVHQVAGLQMIVSPPLSQLKKNQEAKMQLWKWLQGVLGL